MNINKLLFKNITTGFQELQNRLYYTFLSLIVIRTGYLLTIPGIPFFYENMSNNFINFIKIFSKGNILYSSLFTLGIMPYISASIIIQLLTIIFPCFFSLKKEGLEGKYKINIFTRYLTLLISILQSTFLSFLFLKRNIIGNFFIQNNKYIFISISITSLVTSTMFLVWLGENITEYGLGNGVSFIIFINIISGLPNYLLNIYNNFYLNDFYYINFLLMLFFLFIFIFFIILVEMAQRRILIQYSIKNFRNNKYSFLNNRDTYLPLKINLAGVLPSIFASSIMIFPSIFFIWLNNKLKFSNLYFLVKLFYPKQFLYLFLYLLLIVFFCFFYILLIFNPSEIADNLKKSGTYIPNVRPGVFTANYIKKIVLYLTLFNSIYMCLINLIPNIISEITKFNFSISGFSLLIIVVVVIELISQIQSLLISNKYLSILRKNYF